MSVQDLPNDRLKGFLVAFDPVASYGLSDCQAAVYSAPALSKYLITDGNSFEPETNSRHLVTR